MTPTLSKIYDGIYEISDQFRSHKSAIKGFADSPKGYLYIYSIDYIDADIRNGGIYQAHANSTWSLIPDAIEGADAFGLGELKSVLLEILFYYHQKGRSKHKKRVNDDYFSCIEPGWDKDLDTLEDDYYDAFDTLDAKRTTDLWETIITDFPELFEEEV